MESDPLRVVIIDDYEVVVMGVARMLEPFADRVEVVQVVADAAPTKHAHIGLYDTFAAAQGPEIDRETVLEASMAERLVVYTWNFGPELVESAFKTGVSGYLSKRLTGEELVEALEAIHAGEMIVSSPSAEPEEAELHAGDWPGRAEGLSEREAEVIALIVQGLSNEQVASRAYLSINTVKSYIRTAYRKMGVSSRSQAVLWGIDHGFRLRQVRKDPREEDED